MQCEKCNRPAQVISNDNTEHLCLSHAKLDKDTFIAIAALKRAGLVP